MSQQTRDIAIYRTNPAVSTDSGAFRSGLVPDLNFAVAHRHMMPQR
jgi:hypothetical protein